MSGFSYIRDVPPGTIRLGILLGLMRYDEKDKVYEFTPRGAEWFGSWLDEKLAAAKTSGEGAEPETQGLA